MTLPNDLLSSPCRQYGQGYARFWDAVGRQAVHAMALPRMVWSHLPPRRGPRMPATVPSMRHRSYGGLANRLRNHYGYGEAAKARSSYAASDPAGRGSAARSIKTALVRFSDRRSPRRSWPKRGSSGVRGQDGRAHFLLREVDHTRKGSQPRRTDSPFAT
jgi:hypothetical protein